MPRTICWTSSPVKTKAGPSLPLASRDGRPPGVPVGELLEEMGGGNHGAVVSHTPGELQANRKLRFAEPARNAYHRQAAEVTDPTERIGEVEIGLQVGFERRGDDGQRRGRQDIEALEQRVNFLLQDPADAHGAEVVGSGKLLVDVARDLAERVVEFRDRKSG